MVAQCREGKARERAAFGRLGKDDVAAIFSVVEKRLSAATAKCQPEEGEAMEEEAAKPQAGTAELYGMVQLMVALTTGSDGLRGNAATKTAATARLAECVEGHAEGAEGRAALQSLSTLMQAIAV